MSLSISGDAQNKSQAVVLKKQQESAIVPHVSADLQTQVRRLQALTQAPHTKTFRRFLFFWLRIYVDDKNDNTRVNIHIPIPIPLLGALLPRRMPLSQALMLQNILQESDDPAQTLRDYLQTAMAVEFVRVEGDDEFVLIGLD